MNENIRSFRTIDEMKSHPAFSDYTKEFLEETYKRMRVSEISAKLRQYEYYVYQNIGRISVDEMDTINKGLNLLLRISSIELEKVKEKNLDASIGKINEIVGKLNKDESKAKETNY